MNDLISRQAAIDAIEHRLAEPAYQHEGEDWYTGMNYAESELYDLPPAQPGIIRCKECIYYDPPHIDDKGERREYKDMPEEAFDELGTGLVVMEYGINIGGRCTRDYNVGYSEDKRVFVGEDNYCGRAERQE